MKKIIFFIALGMHFATHPLAFRDGCKKVGEPCDCAGQIAPGLSEECYESKRGFCFQGYHYGDESVYCQCHGNVLQSDELEARQEKIFNNAALPAADKAKWLAQIKAKKLSYYSYQIPREARLQTDGACAARPKYGYDGQGFVELVKELNRLADQGKLFKRGSYVPQSPEKPSAMPNMAAIKAALSSVQTQITDELATFYSSKSKPSDVKPLIKIYERENRPDEPCMRFKERLKKALQVGPDIEFTNEANNLINSTCGQPEQTREDLDPCICGNTKTPGVCRVNLCVNPGVLRCHCD